MNKRPILVAFSNQKGGVGKSTVTAVLASYFNYVRGLKVAVVDCDYPQFSLEKLRGRDLKNLEKSEYHQRLFCRQFEDGSRKAYPIVTSTPEAAAEIPGKLEGDYDILRSSRNGELPWCIRVRHEHGFYLYSHCKGPYGHAEQPFLCIDRSGFYRTASGSSPEGHTFILEPYGQPYFKRTVCNV